MDMDTDSFIVRVKTEDIYEDIPKNVQQTISKRKKTKQNSFI